MSKKVERKGSFKSISGDELKDFYSSSNNEKNYNIDPGSFPYTRGIHKNMYRGKLWTMRQFSGFSTPEKTNERYKYLLKNGQTGLSVAYDMPTLMGYDPDHELSSGEVGVCGVNVAFCFIFNIYRFFLFLIFIREFFCILFHFFYIIIR